ncbi:cobalt-precorrin-5B (C(1))-methyltransferase [Candidatus Spongiihabitans sp.]|uniref:cobalt-precorrin-5B (C(1))-methyltransferase n=1 Tax=Candidatus Spongiihabitans sp. TaxID=3101308 RepID=UPI003C701F69
MREESSETKQKLRSGFTTGACATATSLAAANLLINNIFSERVRIVLPQRSQTRGSQTSENQTSGKQVNFKLERCERIGERRAIASTIKDAGDDPDATHLATIFSEVELSAVAGVRFHAAAGVGTVTRDGLSIAVGEPAINPVPRKMMTEHLLLLADESGYAGGFEVHIGVLNGAKIALDTMNGKLGIVGGLSILGTTGIVKPYSCSAFIASIHQSIDVAHANGVEHIAASTGSTSEHYIQKRLQLPEIALVEMGDFAGAVFKHLRKVPMKKLSLCGGFGKMSKMAAGHHSLHSHDWPIDFSFLAGLADELGAGKALTDKIEHANTSLAALKYCQADAIPLANKISQLARQTALKAAQNKVHIDVYCIDKAGNCVGTSFVSSAGDDYQGVEDQDQNMITRT